MGTETVGIVDTGEEPWNATDMDGFEHEPGEVNAETEVYAPDHQPRYLGPQVAREGFDAA
jgi:hypothetical protein